MVTSTPPPKEGGWSQFSWNVHLLRYVPDPNMDKDFHTKSSMFGWLLHTSIERLMSPIIIQYWMILFIQYWMWSVSSIIGCYYIISFWMKLTWYNNHPLLDVIYHHFLDENYMKELSSLIGWFLPSLSGWNLYSTIIIHQWMFLCINFWIKVVW